MANEAKPYVTVFLCRGRGRTRLFRCQSCGFGDGSLQCDYPVKRKPGESQTCDRYVCPACALEVGKDKHYCPPHARLARSKNKPEAINAPPKIEARTDTRYAERRSIVKMPARFSGRCADCRAEILERAVIYYLPEFFLTGVGKLPSVTVCEDCGEGLGYDREE